MWLFSKRPDAERPASSAATLSSENAALPTPHPTRLSGSRPSAAAPSSRHIAGDVEEAQHGEGGEEDEAEEEEDLELPKPLAPEEEPWLLHHIQRGDTLSGLALRYNLTVRARSVVSFNSAIPSKNVPNSQVDDIKRANGLFSNSFGLKTELKMPKRSGVAAVNEVLRVVRLPCLKLLQRELTAVDCQPIPLQAIAGDCE